VPLAKYSGTTKATLVEQARIFTKQHPYYAVSSIVKIFGLDALSSEQLKAYCAQFIKR